MTQAVTHYGASRRAIVRHHAALDGTWIYMTPRPRAVTLKDGRTVYRVRFRLSKGGNPVSETFDTVQAAVQFAREVEAVGGEAARELRRSYDGLDEVRTLRAAFEDHLATLGASATPGTIEKYRRIAEHSWLPVLGKTPTCMITRDAVRKWVAVQRHTPLKRGQGTYSTKSIRNQHAVLSATLQHEVDEGRLARNVAKGVKMPSDKRVTREPVFLTEYQFLTLLSHIPDVYQLLVLTLYGTGMRWGEVTALTPAAFQFDAHPATVRVIQAWKQGADSRPYLGTPKTRRSVRTITLPVNLARELYTVCEARAAQAFIFTTPTGQPLRSGPFHSRVWQPAVKAAALGVSPRIHDLRHSHASALIAAGVSLPVIQRRLGHENIQTTINTYGHLAPDAYAGATHAAELMLTAALPQIEP